MQIAGGARGETAMNVHYLPLPIYEHVRDHLEQALAIVPRDEDSAKLRLRIEEAIELALELAYQRPGGPVPARHNS